MNVDISVNEQNISILRIEGKIIGSTAKGFRQEMERQLELGNVKLIVDLKAVPLIDSTALGAIIVSVRGFQESGGKLVILNTQKAVQNVLEVTHLASVIEIYDTEESAFSAFK